MSFVHLHVHTEYSFLDGANRPADLAARVKALGMPACAITDHGNMFGAVDFYKEMKKADVKPIIGCEMYVAPGSRFDRPSDERLGSDDESPDAGSNNHLIVLAANNEGYKNLVKLVSAGFTEGFYRKPRIDKELLKAHREGLICLSSCLKGEVSEALKLGRLTKAKESALAYREILGAENFFLEIQDHGIPDQQKIIPMMAKLGEETGLRLVATNDSHYLHKEDSSAHDVLLAIGTGRTLHDEKRMRFYSDNFYIKSAEEMTNLFPGYPEALANTLEIANRVDVSLDPSGYHLPKFPVPAGFDLTGYFESKVKEGLDARLSMMAPLFETGQKKNPIAAYRERLQGEIEVIRKMGFEGYFLVVWDFIRYARESGIPVGPGRGSAAGSLVAYSLGITDVDPLQYDLLFERFLNPDRISMPDIDIDFCMNNRGRVIEYVRQKYGEENVAQIITFGRMAARSVVRDVGRALGHPVNFADKIAKSIPAGPEVPLAVSVESSPALREYVGRDKQAKELIDIASRLQGLTRQAGVHAAGVVITPEPVRNYVPLFRTNRNEIVTQYNMNIIEELGLLKMDFLGLRTLTVIDDTVKAVSQQLGIELDVTALPLDDPDVFRLFQEGRTKGVFQFESGGMVDLLRKARPTRFEDLAALNALYRPGALDAGMVEEFVRRKNGRSKSRYLVPEMKELLEETYGVIVYQEQVMKIAQRIGNFTLGQADELRKAMSKKDAVKMEKMRLKFVSGAVANGISKDKGDEIFDYIEPFGRYGFNKSHSVAYALVAYQTAWLKAHYPRHFMAAVLTSEMDRNDVIVKFIKECSSMGISVLPPDVNESNFWFTVAGENIRFGLGAVKGAGEGAIQSILDARAGGGTFQGLYDFCQRVDLRACNRKVVEALIKSGSFDFSGETRLGLSEELEGAMESSARIKEQKESGQGALFGFGMAAQGSGENELRHAPLTTAEWPEDQKLAFEKETLGFYITGHPLNRFQQELELFASASSEALAQNVDETVRIGGIVSQLKKTKIKKGPNEGKQMAKFVLEDQFGSVDAVVFSDLFQKYERWLENGLAVLVTAAVRDTGGVPGGRSASLAGAEQEANRMSDEYGGHPESGFEPSVTAAYEVRDTGPEATAPGSVPAVPVNEPENPNEKSESELERERVGVDAAKFSIPLFGPGNSNGEELDAEGESGISEVDAEKPLVTEAKSSIDPERPVVIAKYAELPVTPELNVLEIIPLEGIRDRKVREIWVELSYSAVDDKVVGRLRDILAQHQGEVPVLVSIAGLPVALADHMGSAGVRLKLSHHFRVSPSPAFSAAVEALNANVAYAF